MRAGTSGPAPPSPGGIAGESFAQRLLRPAAASSAWWVPGGALFLARASDAILRFGLFFATAKLLDPAAFSTFALLTAALSTCQWLLALGAPRVALYFHARGERGPLFAWLYLLAAAGSAVVLIAGGPTLRTLFFRDVTLGLVLLGLAPLPFQLLGDSLGAALVAARRLRTYVPVLWFRNVATAVTLATALLARDRLAWVLWGRLLVQALVAALLAVAARAAPDWSGVRRFAPAALRYGGPTALTSGAVALHRRADVLLLSALGRGAQIGAYSLAQAMAEAFWLVTDSLENTLFVDVTRLQEPRAREEALRAFRLYLWLGIVGLLAGVAAGEVAARIFFRGYPGIGALLPWLLAAAVAWGVARPFYAYLTSRERVGIALACHVAGLGVNVALCLLWIPTAGAAGAARACLVSYAIQSVLFGLAFRGRRTAAPG